MYFFNIFQLLEQVVVQYYLSFSISHIGLRSFQFKLMFYFNNIKDNENNK